MTASNESEARTTRATLLVSYAFLPSLHIRIIGAGFIHGKKEGEEGKTYFQTRNSIMKKQVNQYCALGPKPCPITSVKLLRRRSRSIIRIRIFSLRISPHSNLHPQACIWRSAEMTGRKLGRPDCDALV